MGLPIGSGGRGRLLDAAKSLEYRLGRPKKARTAVLRSAEPPRHPAKPDQFLGPLLGFWRAMMGEVGKPRCMIVGVTTGPPHLLTFEGLDRYALGFACNRATAQGLRVWKDLHLLGQRVPT